MFRKTCLRFAALLALAIATPLAVTMTATAVSASDYTIGALKLDHPFSRATPPMARTGAGYVTITNTGDAADRLVAVECACSEVAEIHEMSMDGNVMRMRQLPDGLAIPAGGTAKLEPGGYHLMFIRLKQPFVEGETVTATLTFEKAGSVEVSFDIGPLRPKTGASGSMKGHDHSGHQKTN